MLVLCGAITPTSLPGGDRDPREEDTEDESEDEDERRRSGHWSGAAPRRTTKNKDEDSGSELDM